MFYLLLIYFIFLIAYTLFSVVAIYHLWRFGYVGDLTRVAIVIYVVISIAIIAVSIMMIGTRPWTGIIG